jgi:hypothetical protein
MGKGGMMKIKVNTDKLGAFGAKLLLVGLFMVIADMTYRLVSWLVSEEWTLLVGGVMVAAVGGGIVIVAVITELRMKGEA